MLLFLRCENLAAQETGGHSLSDSMRIIRKRVYYGTERINDEKLRTMIGRVQDQQKNVDLNQWYKKMKQARLRRGFMTGCAGVSVLTGALAGLVFSTGLYDPATRNFAIAVYGSLAAVCTSFAFLANHRYHYRKRRIVGMYNFRG